MMQQANGVAPLTTTPSVYAGIYDPFPTRVIKFFFISPKKTESDTNLVERMRQWVSDAFGEATLRECLSGIQTIGTYREAVCALGSLTPNASETMTNFHQMFDTQYSKQAFAYYRLLSEFVTKTRGTAASKGLDKLDLIWYHPFDPVIGRVATDSLTYELYATLWNLAAAYSIYATFLPQNLFSMCKKEADGGVFEPAECLKHRTVNFRRGALVLDLLERIMERTGYFVDEFNPKICKLMRLLMLAQAQLCTYYAHKTGELAQRLQHASVANAALFYYREAFIMLEQSIGDPSQEGLEIGRRDLTNPAEHLPRSLKAYCMSCGIFVKTSMITHLMEVDKGDTSMHGRIMGNCLRLCTMLRSFINKIVTMDGHADVANLQTVLEVERHYKQLYKALEERNLIFKEPTVHPDVLENEDPTKVDSVSLGIINVMDISDGLRQVYTEEPIGKFSCIISQEANRLWSEYRKRKATAYRLHNSQLAELRTRLLSIVESPTARFPLLYLYLVAHSMGVSKRAIPPSKTPLGTKLAALIQGDSAWHNFIVAHDAYLEWEKKAGEMAKTLSVDASDARGAFQSAVTAVEVTNYALDAPLERSKAILEEFRAFRVDRASQDSVGWATELRNADSFIKEMQRKSSMPDAFWAQVADSNQRVPLSITTTAATTTTATRITDGDELVEVMNESALADAQAEAKKALKSGPGATTVAPIAAGSGRAGGFFSMLSMPTFQSKTSSLDALGTAEQLVSAPAQALPKPTQFANADQNLRTVKLMLLVVRLVDDVFLSLETLNDDLATSMLTDIAAQNTEIPPAENTPDLVSNKLQWLNRFTSNTEDMRKLGMTIMDQIQKIEIGKDQIVEEINAHFGFSSAGGPPSGSRCVLLTVCAELMAAARGYRLCEKVFSQIVKEGGYVSSQCKAILNLKAKKIAKLQYQKQQEQRSPATSAAPVARPMRPPVEQVMMQNSLASSSSVSSNGVRVTQRYARPEAATKQAGFSSGGPLI